MKGKERTGNVVGQDGMTRNTTRDRKYYKQNKVEGLRAVNQAE